MTISGTLVNYKMGVKNAIDRTLVAKAPGLRMAEQLQLLQSNAHKMHITIIYLKNYTRTSFLSNLLILLLSSEINQSFSASELLTRRHLA